MEKLRTAIGGYLELEASEIRNCYHPQAIALNTARNALEYLLRVRTFKQIYIPYFTCEVLLEPMAKLIIPVRLYAIDEQLEPLFDFTSLNDDDAFLYTNYFGLKSDYVAQLARQCKQLIVDNAQAFFDKPFQGEPTIYSARKFFGVADGAYLYTDTKSTDKFEQDSSYDRMAHLLIRKDDSAEAGYRHFVANDKALEQNPIKIMSRLTTAILGSIDYETVAQKRIENYRCLEKALHQTNKLTLRLSSDSVPMVYPYWTEDKALRQRLLQEKIYTAAYWPNVKESCRPASLEYRLTAEVVYLPIDQRYGSNDMLNILKYV